MSRIRNCIRAIAWSLLVLTISNESLARPAPACAALFSDAEEVQITAREARNLGRKSLTERRIDYETWSEQLAVRMAKRRMLRSIEETCRNPSTCTEAAVAHIVEESITESFSRQSEFRVIIGRIRGYALLTGLSIGAAIASQFAKSSMPANSQWIAEFVTIGSSVALYKLGAPLWDSMGGFVYRASFRLQDGKSFMRSEDDLSHLHPRHQLLQEKLTPFQQQESNRMLSLLSSVESAVSASIESIMSADPSKGGVDRGAARMASVAIKMFRYFPEVDIDDVDVTRTVRLLFTDMLAENMRDEVYERTIAKIAQADVRFAQPAIEARYRKLISIWIGK